MEESSFGIAMIFGPDPLLDDLCKGHIVVVDVADIGLRPRLSTAPVSSRLKMASKSESVAEARIELR